MHGNRSGTTNTWRGRPKLNLKELARLYKNGLSIREVAQKKNCCPSTVLRACKEHGVTTREVGDKQGKGWRSRRDKRRSA